VLAVNGFAADGNMFVKKVKQRLEVRVPFGFAVWRLQCQGSGTAMRMRRTCPRVLSRS
jgi:hypothetical protein